MSNPPAGDQHAATNVLYQKLCDVVLDDQGANDPNVALSALVHVLVDTAIAAQCPRDTLFTVILQMWRDKTARAGGAEPDPLVDPLVPKPHRC